MQHPEWKSWKWQQQNAIRDFAELKKHLAWLPEGVEQTQKHFGLQITPYYFGLINKEDPNDPLAKVCVPSLAELNWRPEELVDPTGDTKFTPEVAGEKVKGIVHRYPDRCLLLTTTLCSSYCRYCFRREVVSDPESSLSTQQLGRALEYIRNTASIQEVILTGGDPLLLSDAKLISLLTEISAVPHVRLLRVHTKFPVFNPFRVTEALCQALSEIKKSVCFVLHITHPSEVTSDLALALKQLRQTGSMLLNQTVLLKGCNDRVETQKELSYRLAECGVKPYYLHQMDLAKGTSHFRVPLKKAQALLKQMRGQISGHLIPQLTLDLPGGFGKIPVEASYLQEGESNDFKLKSPLDETLEVNYFDSPVGGVD